MSRNGKVCKKNTKKQATQKSERIRHSLCVYNIWISLADGNDENSFSSIFNARMLNKFIVLLNCFKAEKYEFMCLRRKECKITCILGGSLIIFILNSVYETLLIDDYLIVTWKLLREFCRLFCIMINIRSLPPITPFNTIKMFL